MSNQPITVEAAEAEPEEARLFTAGPARRPAVPPATTEEAEARFWRRYGWPLLEAALGPMPRPETIAEWTGLAMELRDYLELSKTERLARRLEDLAEKLRSGL